MEATAAKLGLKITTRTGTHVHLGWTPSLKDLRRLMSLVAYFEPALYTLVAPSRSDNRYCAPIREHLSVLLALPTLSAWEKHFNPHESRYIAVNPSNLFKGLETLEIRLHSGTVEGPKILAWLALWMRLLAVASSKKAIPAGTLTTRSLPLTKGPQGDVATLADYVVAGPALSKYLVQRRNAVMAYWVQDSTHGTKAREVLESWS